MAYTRWVVVGTDFSEGAAHALERAIDLAAEFRASIACVHAYEDEPGTPLAQDRTPALRAQVERTIVASGARARGVQVEVFVRRGLAWDKLLNVACELGAGVIVVGAGGAGQAPRQGCLGTVSARLAATSTRMVLLVPPHTVAPQPLEERGTLSHRERVSPAAVISAIPPRSCR